MVNIADDFESKKRKEGESILNQVAALLKSAELEGLKNTPEYKKYSAIDSEFDRKLNNEGVTLEDINCRFAGLEAMSPLVVKAASSAFNATGLPRTSSDEDEVSRISKDFANQRKLTEDLFPKFDTNGDGKLNRDEYQNLTDATNQAMRAQSLKEIATTLMEASKLKPLEASDIKIPDAFKVVRGEMNMDQYVDETMANAKAALEARQTTR